MMLEWQAALLATARVAHLATVDEAGQPHVLPIVFVFVDGRLLSPLDGKPKRVDGMQLQRVRNIAANDRVSVVVDHYDDDWRRLAWVQLRGRAALLSADPAYDAGIALLRDKYPQYAHTPLGGRPLIAVAIEQVRGWRAGPPAEP